MCRMTKWRAKEDSTIQQTSQHDDNQNNKDNGYGNECQHVEHQINIGLRSEFHCVPPAETEQLPEVAEHNQELGDDIDGEAMGGQAWLVRSDERHEHHVLHDELRAEIGKDKGVFPCVEPPVHACVTERQASTDNVKRYDDDERQRMVVFPVLHQIH